MIEFKDYPNLTTSIDSENLNANFNELKNEYGASGVDANNYTKTGMYYLQQNCTNVPQDYVRLFVNGYDKQNSSDADVAQIAISVTTVPNIWIRCKVTGTWQTWKVFQSVLKADYTSLVTLNSNFTFHAFNFKEFIKYNFGLVTISATFNNTIELIANNLYVLCILPTHIRPSGNVAINAEQWEGISVRAYIRAATGEVIFIPKSNMAIDSEQAITATYSI